MDAVLDVLLVLSLAGVFAYAFAVYEALKIMCAWAKARWRDEWGKRPPHPEAAALGLDRRPRPLLPGGGPVTPDILSAYQVEGFLEWASSFFGAVPIGFLLAMFLGLLAFGISGAFRLAQRLFRS